jgi:phospholipase/carboxylesterase
MHGGDGSEREFFEALGSLGAAVLAGLDALEQVQRRLHPPDLPRLRAALQPAIARLDGTRERFSGAAAPEGLAALQRQLLAAVAAVDRALVLFGGRDDAARPAAAGIARVLAALRAHCRAQEELYPLRVALPPVSRHFVEAPFRGDLSRLEPEPALASDRREEFEIGLLRARAPASPGAPVGSEPSGRGGFSLYVPESYDGSRAWPLVVALHGGSGDGRDFVWTWLREARGRRFLLLAPTSRGATWSFMGKDVDAPALAGMVAAVSRRWNVDPERILLTGLSDGATYTLVAGLQEGMPFTALAPVSGVLHPVNYAIGNLERAAGRRIYLVHGSLDWMFPVALARVARDELEKAGASVVFREIEDLSHAYPREENDRILAWFDPSLALPGGAAPAGGNASGAQES